MISPNKQLLIRLFIIACIFYILVGLPIAIILVGAGIMNGSYGLVLIGTYASILWLIVLISGFIKIISLNKQGKISSVLVIEQYIEEDPEEEIDPPEGDKLSDTEPKNIH